jgi:hypothetical protein
MGNDMVPRIAFRDLADVKTMISVLMDGFEATTKAAMMVSHMGLPTNSPEAGEARDQAKEYAEILLVTYEEFARLHAESDCQCGTTDTDIRRAMENLRDILESIEDDARKAAEMPPYNPSSNPLAALMSQLGLSGADGGPGIKVMSADELFGTLGGQPEDSAAPELGMGGTGMYL